MSRLKTLADALTAAFGDKLVSVATALGEVTAVVRAEHLLEIAASLRDAAELRFEQLTDLCGVDYSAYGGNWDSGRFAVVYHLLSLTHNWRMRLRTFATEDEFPVVD